MIRHLPIELTEGQALVFAREWLGPTAAVRIRRDGRTFGWFEIGKVQMAFPGSLFKVMGFSFDGWRQALVAAGAQPRHKNAKEIAEQHDRRFA